MFNKPNLFPKQTESVGQRSAPTRPATMGSSVSPSSAAASSDPVQEVTKADSAKSESAAPVETATGGSRLIVGPDVKLKGAEIHGRFEGELTARQQLIIHATGRVSGKIRYGKILIEEGGEVSGDVQSLTRAGAKEGLRAVESRGNDSKPIAAVAG